MIIENATNSIKLDQLIEQFESNWSESSWRVLTSSSSKISWQELQEIARIDIDWRYLKGIEVNLDDYDVLGDSLKSEWWGPILYEDYRGRSRTRLKCEAARWLNYLAGNHPDWLVGLITLEKMEGSRPLGSRNSLNLLSDTWPEIGSHVGDFEVRELLGVGSFSRVYLAVQNSLGKRRVVLKFTSMPQQEPEWLGRFQHSNIVPVYSIHQWNSLSVLCMPYCGQLTLADLLSRGITSTQIDLQGMMDTVRSIDSKEMKAKPYQLSSHLIDESNRVAAPQLKSIDVAQTTPAKLSKTNQATLEVFRKLASALYHSHNLGVIHGDIKPANILIRLDGEPALFDFNLSQSLGVQLTSVKGTLPYLAPEQLSGWADQRPCMTVSTDIYSLGLVFVELLTGRLPEIFREPLRTKEYDLRDAAAQRGCFDWNREIAGLPAGVQSIVLKMLCCDPALRYANAHEVEHDLNAEISNLPLKYAKEPFTNRIKKRIVKHRNPLSIAVLVGLVIGLICILTIGGLQWSRLARRTHAITFAKDFIAQSQNSISNLYSALGNIDRNRLMECLDVANRYDALLFNGDSPATIWLTPELRANVENARSMHLLLSAFALERVLETSPSQNLEIFDAYPPGEYEFVAEEIRQFYRHCKDSVGSDLALNEVFSDWTKTEVGYLGAAIHGELGDWKTSQAYLDLADSSPDKIGLYWFLRGRNQLMLDDAEGAYLSFSLAIGDKPDLVGAMVGRGFASLKKGQTVAAIKDFDSAIKIQPDEARLYEHRSNAKMVAGDFQGALEDAEWILRRDSTRASIRVMRYRLLLALNRTSEAENEWSYVLGCKPSLSTDYVVRAVARMEAQPDEAWDDLTRAGELDPNSTVVWQNKAYLASEIMKDDIKSIKCLDRVLELQPYNVEGLSGRAVLHARTGNAASAAQDIAKALKYSGANYGPSEYHAACVFALLAKNDQAYRDQANKYLARALHHGYGLESISNDPDLNNLRNSKEFGEILQVSQLAIDSETSESKD